MTQPTGSTDDSTPPRRTGWGDSAYGERFETGQAPDVSQPRYGWGLIGSAVLLLIGSLTPWAYIHGDLVRQTDIGIDIIWSALIGGAVLAALGLLIVARRGQLWVSLSALVLSGIFLLIMLLTGDSLTLDEARKYEVNLTDVTVAYGVWLTIVGVLGAAVFAVFAMIRRTASPATSRRWRR